MIPLWRILRCCGVRVLIKICFRYEATMSKQASMDRGTSGEYRGNRPAWIGEHREDRGDGVDLLWRYRGLEVDLVFAFFWGYLGNPEVISPSQENEHTSYQQVIQHSPHALPKVHKVVFRSLFYAVFPCISRYRLFARL